MTGVIPMHISVIGAVLSLAILTAAATTQASDSMPTQPEEEQAALGSFLVLGRITQIDAQSLLIQEDGEAPIRVGLTSETVAPGNLQIGDQVVISVSQKGSALLITRGHIEAEASLLDESTQNARER